MLIEKINNDLFDVFRVCCAEISDDASMLAVGFSDSRVKVWSLVPQKLKTMKSAEQLQDINLEAGSYFDVFFCQFV